jgi:hypothetical protein
MRRLILAVSAVAAVSVQAETLDDGGRLAAILERAGERVERYFRRAQSILCLEVVYLQPLSSSWSMDGFGRTVESELRLSWEPAPDGTPSPEAQMLRQLLKVNGQPPRHDDWKNCTSPEQQTEEPQALSMLLPAQRRDYEFKYAGETRIDGRRAYLIEYRLRKDMSVDAKMIEGRDDCVSFKIEGGMRGRIWVDLETHDVLRLDERLGTLVDIPLPRQARRRADRSYWTMERWDTSIRFKSVTFSDPEETIVLPESRTSMQVTRGSGTPRLRTMTTYRNYQRFVTGARVVGDGEKP